MHDNGGCSFPSQTHTWFWVWISLSIGGWVGAFRVRFLLFNWEFSFLLCNGQADQRFPYNPCHDRMKNSCFRKQKRKLKKNIYGSKTMQQLSTTDLMKIIIAHTGWDFFPFIFKQGDFNCFNSQDRFGINTFKKQKGCWLLKSSRKLVNQSWLNLLWLEIICEIRQ